jgi:hypothetical protein
MEDVVSQHLPIRPNLELKTRPKQLLDSLLLDITLHGLSRKPTRGAPLRVGTFLALPRNNRPGWKGLPGTNRLAYYEINKLRT